MKMELTDKGRLEIGVSEPFVERCVNALLQSARTGGVGDGKIFVTELVEVYRIRTGETGDQAI